MKVRQARFRALITLDPPGRAPRRRGAPAQQYPDHTRALMIGSALRSTGSVRYFPTETCWDSERPLRPGDHAVVTITVADDEASAFFATGQRFALWSGDVGHGTISRKVCTDYSPS
jgi:hypothetical protein